MTPNPRSTRTRAGFRERYTMAPRSAVPRSRALTGLLVVSFGCAGVTALLWLIARISVRWTGHAFGIVVLLCAGLVLPAVGLIPAVARIAIPPRPALWSPVTLAAVLNALLIAGDLVESAGMWRK